MTSSRWQLLKVLSSILVWLGGGDRGSDVAAKALAILVTGHQPALLFELPLVLLPLGSIGLHL